jgi:hypothetical protein
MDTHPYLYAIEPQATKVPAEKKLMNKDKPPINQGTASPPAKKDLRFLPVRANNIPVTSTKALNTKITIVSIVELIVYFGLFLYFFASPKKWYPRLTDVSRAGKKAPRSFVML